MRNLMIWQGVFFAVSGLWPVFNIGSFEKVTGPKTDDWLVKTVGLLLGVSGLVFLKAGLQTENGRRPDGNLCLLACGEAAVLGSVSLVYSSKNRISKIYLLDTGVEYGLVGAWGALSRRAA